MTWRAVHPIVRLRQTIFAGRKVMLPIAKDARVLEVGGGDSPSPRADVLVDFALEPRERWGGRIERDDRPLVLARGEALPFRDKSFDYVIAFHVLEHSEHPEVFLSELQRVAAAGYIETPSFWSERVLPLAVHRSEVAAIDDGTGPMLIIRKKSAAVCRSAARTRVQGEDERGCACGYKSRSLGDAFSLEGSNSIQGRESGGRIGMAGGAGFARRFQSAYPGQADSDSRRGRCIRYPAPPSWRE